MGKDRETFLSSPERPVDVLWAGFLTQAFFYSPRLPVHRFSLRAVAWLRFS